MKKKKLVKRKDADAETPEALEAPRGGPLPYSRSRKQQIARLEKARDAIVLVMINRGGRTPRTALRYLFEHLRGVRGRTHDRIALVVHNGRASATSPHGELEDALRLVALLREHAREIEVFVPADAYGVGTYLAIGADRLFVHPLGSLGRLGAADALAPSRHFLRLLSDAGVGEDAVPGLLGKLVDELGAERLGEARYVISRLNSGIRELVSGRVHRRQEAQNQALFEALLDSACPLAHALDRRRAKELLSLPIESLNPELEGILWELFSAYEHPMRLADPPPEGHRAPNLVLESTSLCHCHMPPAPPSKHKSAAGTRPQQGWVRVVGTEVQ